MVLHSDVSIFCIFLCYSCLRGVARIENNDKKDDASMEDIDRNSFRRIGLICHDLNNF